MIRHDVAHVICNITPRGTASETTRLLCMHAHGIFEHLSCQTQATRVKAAYQSECVTNRSDSLLARKKECQRIHNIRSIQFGSSKIQSIFYSLFCRLCRTNCWFQKFARMKSFSMGFMQQEADSRKLYRLKTCRYVWFFPWKMNKSVSKIDGLRDWVRKPEHPTFFWDIHKLRNILAPVIRTTSSHFWEV